MYYIPHNWVDTIKVVINAPRKLAKRVEIPFIDTSNRLTARLLKEFAREVEEIQYANGQLPPRHPLPVPFSLYYNIKMDMMVNGVLLKCGWTAKEISFMECKRYKRRSRAANEA